VWPGAFAEYMLTHENCLFHKPPEITFDAAALTEPLSGAWKGVIQYSEMQVGDDVVVIGTGGIGLLCLMVARAAGAGRLIAVDTSDYALGNALALGATHAVNPRTGGCAAADLRHHPRRAGPGCRGRGAYPGRALMVDLRRRGTRWNVFGITTHEKFELDGGLTHFLEGRMDASFGTTPVAMAHAIRLMARGLVDPEKIVSHRFPLAEIDKALEVQALPDRNKVIINP
jgi:L-iditol 2-dehydrogenase